MLRHSDLNVTNYYMHDILPHMKLMVHSPECNQVFIQRDRWRERKKVRIDFTQLKLSIISASLNTMNGSSWQLIGHNW